MLTQVPGDAHSRELHHPTFGFGLDKWHTKLGSVAEEQGWCRVEKISTRLPDEDKSHERTPSSIDGNVCLDVKFFT